MFTVLALVLLTILVIFIIITIRLSIKRYKINALYKKYIEYANNYYSPEYNSNLYFDNHWHKIVILKLADVKSLGSPPILKNIEEKANEILWDIAYCKVTGKKMEPAVILEYIDFLKNVNLK